MAITSPPAVLRPLAAADLPLLRAFLYHAVFVPAGATPPPEAIVDQPELRRYIAGWGRPGDDGLLAEDAGGRALGAAWLRVWPAAERGYGYVDRGTPELSIAVLPAERGRGLGGRLLRALLDRARGRWPAVSLSVDRANPAVRLYARLGFETLHADEHSMIMLKLLE